MEVLAKGKYIKISSKKARPIADLVRGKNTKEALVLLGAMPQSAAREIKQVLESAIANAENNFNLEKSNLTISKITIDAGPFAKRYMPRAQGRAFQIKRRTSHIEVVVSGDMKSKKKLEERPKEAIKESKENVIDGSSKKVGIEKVQGKSGFSGSQKTSSPKIFRRKTG